MERDERGRLVISNPITIQELYDIACEEGIQDRRLNVVVRRKSDKSVYTNPTCVRFGSWWTKGDAVLILDELKLIHESCGAENSK